MNAETLAACGYASRPGRRGIPYVSRTIAHPSAPARAFVLVAMDSDGFAPRADDWSLGLWPLAAWEGDGVPMVELSSGAGPLASFVIADQLASRIARAALMGRAA